MEASIEPMSRRHLPFNLSAQDQHRCGTPISYGEKALSGAERQGARSPTPLSPLKRVAGPDGAPLMRSDLPPPNTTRWVIRRKAQVVVAVRSGLIEAEEVYTRYGLTAEELSSWNRAFDRFGMRGLCAGRRPTRECQV
jgi:Protein of unknown function (DUF1153)